MKPAVVIRLRDLGGSKKPTAEDADPLDEIIKGKGMDDSESEPEELPPGLVSAVAEMRSAESDEDAARALLRAVRSCEGGE